MTIRSKLLDALGDITYAISDERLVDLLLDVLKRKDLELQVVKGENSHEREAMRAERENMRYHRQMMISDPVYWATGRYYFTGSGVKFWFEISGKKVAAFQCVRDVTYCLEQVSADEFERVK